MRAFSTLLFSLFFVTAAGCVRSVNPFYTEGNVVFEPELVGEWQVGIAAYAGGSAHVTISAGADGASYDIFEEKDGEEQGGEQQDEEEKDGKEKSRPQRAVLFKVGDHFLLDFESTEDGATWHSLAKVVASGHSVLLYHLSYTKVDSLIDGDPTALKHLRPKRVPVKGGPRDASDDAPLGPPFGPPGKPPVTAPEEPPAGAPGERAPFHGITLTDTSAALTQFVSKHANTLFADSMVTYPLIRPAGGRSPPESGNGLFSRRQRTFDHWSVMDTALRQRSGQGSERGDIAKYLRATQDSLAKLSVIGVDDGALRVWLDVIRFCAAVDHYLWDEASDQQAIDAIVHGLGEKSFTKAFDSLDDGHELRQKLRHLKSVVREQQQMLGDRYKMKFPPLDL